MKRFIPFLINRSIHRENSFYFSIDELNNYFTINFLNQAIYFDGGEKNNFKSFVILQEKNAFVGTGTDVSWLGLSLDWKMYSPINFLIVAKRITQRY